jgi:hypothetical protein
MAKVITNKPVCPSTTYDLVGLTRDQMLDIAYELYTSIVNTLIGHDGSHIELREERNRRFPGLSGQGSF